KKFLVNNYYFLNSCRNKNCYLLHCYHDCLEYIYSGIVLMADEHNKNNEDEQDVSTNNGGNNSNKASSTNIKEDVEALLCYLGSFVTGIIFIIIEKNSKFVRFHAMQSIVFFGGLVVINFIVGFLPFSTILS